MIDKIDHDDVDTERWDSKNKNFVPKEKFIPKKIDIVDDDNVVKVVIDKSKNHWSVAYVKNGDVEHLSMCGYGFGEHWWLDNDGDEINWENEEKKISN